jgi:hypothetical protein
MNGTFAGVGPWAFGAEGTAALAMLGGALSFVPYVGTIVAMVVRALATLPQALISRSIRSSCLARRVSSKAISSRLIFKQDAFAASRHTYLCYLRVHHFVRNAWCHFGCPSDSRLQGCA